MSRVFVLGWLALSACVLGPAAPAPADPVVPAPPDCRVVVNDPSAMPLRARQGARLSLQVTQGADVTGLRLEQLVSLSDAVEPGTPPVLRVTMPYGQAEAKVVLASMCAGVEQFTQVPFIVEPLQWSRAAEWMGAAGPSPREYFSMWLDPLDANRLWLFGGFVYVPQQFTPNAELWSLRRDVGTWQREQPTGTAPALAGGRVALAPDGKSVLYLGGLDVQRRETPYLLKRLTTDAAPEWSDEPTASGQGRGDYQPGFFYDAKRGRYLSLCGSSSTVGYHCDVRAFMPTPTGGTWTTVVTEGTPPSGRNGHAYAYDAETDRVVLFGGDLQGAILGDTWLLDLSKETPSWRQVAALGSVAAARRNMAFVLDPLNHRLLVWGGTPDGRTALPGLFALDLTVGQERWALVDTNTPPPPRASGAAVFDVTSRQVLVGFGNSPAGAYADLWTLAL